MEDIKNNSKTGIPSPNRIRIIITAFLIISSLTTNAQITLPGGDSNIPDAPIDGFLTIGLVAGALIGLRRHFSGIRN